MTVPHLSEALPQLATLPEVAAEMGVSEKWLADQCRRGRISGVKVGRHWRIHVTKLAAQLNGDGPAEQLGVPAGRSKAHHPSGSLAPASPAGGSSS